MKEVYDKLTEIQKDLATLSQAQLDTKQQVDSHEDRCPMKEYSTTVNSRFDKIDTKFTVILTSGVTVMLFLATVILGIYDGKVGKDDFNTHISKYEEAQIRTDERFQTMFKLVTDTQKDVSAGFNDMKLDMKDLSNKLDKGK